MKNCSLTRVCMQMCWGKLPQWAKLLLPTLRPHGKPKSISLLLVAMTGFRAEVIPSRAEAGDGWKLREK